VTCLQCHAGVCLKHQLRVNGDMADLGGLEIRLSSVLAPGTVIKMPKDVPRILVVAYDVWCELKRQAQ